MNESQKLAAIVAPVCWILGLIGGLVLYFALGDNINKQWSFGYVLGILVSLLNLGFMVKGSKRLLKEVDKEERGKPLRINMMYFFFRVLIFVAIFAMVIVDQFILNPDSPKFNVWATLIGYSTVKIVLLIVSLILKGRVKENEFDNS